MPATRLAASLSRDAVFVHLQARLPEIGRRQDFEALYAAELDGVASEVVAIAGDPPQDDLDSPIRQRALALGVAASIESSLFPEQIVGETSRAEALQRRFVAVLALLRDRYPNGPGSGSGTGSAGARYAFAIVAL